MPSPSIILGNRLEPTVPYKPKIKPIFTNKYNKYKIPTKCSITVPLSPYLKKKQKNKSPKKRPLSARTFNKKQSKKSMNISYGIHKNINDENDYFSIFAPINIEDKPRWIMSNKSGTIYKDNKMRLNKIEKNKKLLKPQIIRQLKQCIKEIENEEIRKHEQRMRILYRFRLRRLSNNLKYRHYSILQGNPIIFTPELNKNINPFNPKISDIEKYTTNKSQRIENLAQPRFRYNTQTPELTDFSIPEIQKIIKSIKNLKNIRNQYHWRSFAHRHINNIDIDNLSQCTDDTVDTLSTCSTNISII